MTVLADTLDHTSSHGSLVAALLGIATVVLLITALKVHPFLALMLGAAVRRTSSRASPPASGRRRAAWAC